MELGVQRAVALWKTVHLQDKLSISHRQNQFQPIPIVPFTDQIICGILWLMPIIKSAQKRMRQAKKRTARNVAVKTTVKKKFKVVKTEILSGKPKDSKALIAAIAEVDRAVKKGVLHKGTAARRKSRLTLAYNAAASKPYGTENPGKAGAKKTVAKKPAAKKAAPTKKPAAKKTAPKK